MELVVTDTNIFIDLYSIGMLDVFFELPIVVHTVDFVLNEINNPQQKEAVSKFVDLGKLNVHSFNSEVLERVMLLRNSAGGNVSIVDCSVWYLAKENNYVLLTGDGRLRAKAIQSNVVVKGIIYVFDSLLECGLINKQEAIDKIHELQKANVRLPKNIINERIEKWT